MKRILFLLYFFILSNILIAQSPEAFKYQAVVRDATGQVIINQEVSFRISLMNGSIDGPVVYTETHSVTTNQFGLVNLEIGNGSTSDDFGSIDWGINTHFIQVELDITGGTNFELMGTSQILSVPYALHSNTSESALSGDYNNLSNTPNIIDSISAVLDTTTLFIQEELDGDSTNEIQTFSVSATGDTLYIGNGNWVIIPYISSTQPHPLLDFDGNEYQTMKIGDQFWMAENLKTTHFADGTPLVDGTGAGDIESDYTTKYYFFYDDDSTTYAETYGALYTWAAVINNPLGSNENPSGMQGICPTGWHVPSDDEWKELESFLGMSNPNLEGWRGTNEGSKLAGFENTWNEGIILFDDEFGVSGFNAIPGGYRSKNGTYLNMGSESHFWSASRSSSEWAYFRYLSSEHTDVWRSTNMKNSGFSVRCVKDDEKVDFDFDQSIHPIGQPIQFFDRSTNMPARWNWDFGDGGTSTIQNPTHSYLIPGIYSVSLTTTNGYESETKTKYNCIFIGTSDQIGNVSDYDGNNYKTILIGDQRWMAQNLKTTHYSDGTLIPLVENGWNAVGFDDKAMCYYANSEFFKEIYGALYSWAAVMNSEDSSNTNPSGVQGVCPDNWHVPSDEEWIELEIYLGMDENEAYLTGYRGTNEGSKLSGNGDLWEDGLLDENPFFNFSGFQILPGGHRHRSGSFTDLNESTKFWTTTVYPTQPSSAMNRVYYYNNPKSLRSSNNKDAGYYVRCVKD
jgi:uncharacterized protein (TIGR02145 family)